MSPSRDSQDRSRRWLPWLLPAPGSRFEVQIHPNDIRRGVFYLFLGRGNVLGLAAAVVVWLALLVFAAWVAPGVIANHLSVHTYQSLIAERESEGNELRPRVGTLEELSSRAGNLRTRLDRVYLAYGLAIDEGAGRGKGGYPVAVSPVPPSVASGIFAQTVRKGVHLQSRIEEQLQVIDVFSRAVVELESAQRSLTRTVPSLCPLKRETPGIENFVLTSPFGNRRNPFTNAPDFHSGVDLAALPGTQIVAPADGRVIFAGRFPERRSIAWWHYGNMVAIAHNDDMLSLYGHCDQVLVRAGQQVRRGERIATVGNSGLSTNPHLHYEVRRRNAAGQLVPVDPRIYMLDLDLSDQEQLLVSRRKAPSFDDFEPLPELIAR